MVPSGLVLQTALTASPKSLPQSSSKAQRQIPGLLETDPTHSGVSFCLTLAYHTCINLNKC